MADVQVAVRFGRKARADARWIRRAGRVVRRVTGAATEMTGDRLRSGI